MAMADNKIPGQGEELAALRGVHKRFGNIAALKGVDLEVRRGEIMALLGPNGAGKTTAISLLLGRRKPDQGTAALFGLDPRLPAARRWVGATPQETAFPWTLTVMEVLDLVRAHFDHALSAKELLVKFDLVDLAARQTGGLSGGQQRRLAVALAFAGRPVIVFLDEPTTGLDVEARRSLWKTIRTFSEEGGTVLLTTHYLEEAEALADRVVVIHQGQVLEEGSVAQIRGRVNLQRVQFEASSLPGFLREMNVRRENETCTVYVQDSDELIRRLVMEGVQFSNLEVHRTSLEEAFLVLTGGEV